MKKENTNRPCVVSKVFCGQTAHESGLIYTQVFPRWKSERYSDANTSFHKIIDNNYILYIEQAEWYLAFCYLMTDDRKKAEEQFGMIADRNGYYQHQARKILKKIN